MTAFIQAMFVAFGFRAAIGLYDLTDPSTPRSLKGPLSWCGLTCNVLVCSWAAWLLWGAQ